MGRKLNRRFDLALARERLERVAVPLDPRVGTLSGGQRAQVALTLALARRPERSCCCWTSRSPASTRWPAASSSRR
jgi:ABC-type multidrug transport system ATPase subunit